MGSAKGHTLKDCMICFNTNMMTGSWESGGGGVKISGKYGTVIGGVIRGNHAASGRGGGVDVFHTAAGDGHEWTFTNVVFDANDATLAGGGGGTSALHLYVTGKVTVRDCWFTGNTSPAGASAGQMLFMDFRKEEAGLEVRNCLFARNESKAPVNVVEGMFAGWAVFENCDFAENTVGDTVMWPYNWESGRFQQARERTVLRNCVMWGNRKANGAVANGLPGAYAQTLSVTNCWDETRAGFAEGEGAPANWSAADFGPGFRDAARGNYALRPNSGLRDKGARLEWMGEADRKSPVKDLGDGTWTERAAARIRVRGREFEVGAVVERNNARARVDWVTGLPDLGCGEFVPDTSFVIYVR